MSTIHASCVALGELGLLIRGQPGAGKSSLCLSLIDAPGLGLGPDLLHAMLVADDQVVLARTAAGLLAAPPAALAGKLELRGLGIIEVPYRPTARIGLVVDLLPQEEIARLPAPEALSAELLGLALPRLMLAVGAADGPSKLRAAISHFGLRQRASFFS